jgi:6-pyruvoyltetrahydropterin/6-carboxytetrahydropterin synthase
MDDLRTLRDGFGRPFRLPRGSILFVEITKEFTFEAAHHLPSVSPSHKCSRTHGHLFRIEVTVAGPLDPVMGWVMDFADLARAAQEVVSELDHRFLNDLPGLGNPTSENLARYLFQRLETSLQGLVSITVHESPSSRCTVRPARPATPMNAPEVRVQTSGLVFSAAHFLAWASGEREPLHGHDYRLNVAARVSGSRSAEVEEALPGLAREAISDLEHRILVAGRSPLAPVRLEGETLIVDLPGGPLALPRRDCTVLDAASTTTEALAMVVAGRLADSHALALLGVTSVEAEIREGLDAVARSEVQIRSQEAP